ncbi:hypothetical protein ABK040_010929 [Willaertia magna]
MRENQSIPYKKQKTSNNSSDNNNNQLTAIGNNNNAGKIIINNNNITNYIVDNNNTIYFNHQGTTFKVIANNNNNEKLINSFQVLFTETQILEQNNNLSIEWKEKEIYNKLNVNLEEKNKNKIGRKLQKYVHLFYEITTFFKDLKLFKVFRFVCKQWNEWILTHELFTFKYKLNHSTNLTNTSLALYFFKWNLFRQKYIKVLQNNLQNDEKDDNIKNNVNIELTDLQLFYPKEIEERFKDKNQKRKEKYKEKSEKKRILQREKLEIIKSKKEEKENKKKLLRLQREQILKEVNEEMKDDDDDEDENEQNDESFIDENNDDEWDDYEKEEDEEILRELEEEDEENEKYENRLNYEEFELNKWIYPVHERNEKTREMRHKLINYLFLLKNEGIYQKLFSVCISDTKICLFNINGNGNYIIVKFNYTLSMRGEMSIVKLKFVNYLQNLELSPNNLDNNNNNYNPKPREKSWETGELYDDGYELSTFEELYKKDKDDNLFHLVSTYTQEGMHSFDNYTRVYVDKEILQKAMTFIGLTNDFVNDENCIMDFHMFISTHLAVYCKLFDLYSEGDIEKLYTYKEN